MNTFIRILLWTFVGFVLIQFIPVNRTNPPIDQKLDFFQAENPPKEIRNILKNSCYDCHSFETKYPKYAYVAPISWSLKNHINKGRKHLNFSTWGKYNKDQKQSILEEIIGEVGDQKMPLPAYVVYHDEAQLSNDDRKFLTRYFQQILDSENY